MVPGLSWNGYSPDLYWRVWIDLNQDGDFNDSGELVLEDNPGNQSIQELIFIPNSAVEGITRMRVSMKKDGFPSSCESFIEGEVEDYSIVISGGSTTSGLLINPGEELLFLRGVTNKEGIQLNWTTNTDFKNEFFAIGRSFDGVNFTAIEHKDAIRSGNNNSVHYQTYDQERLSQGIVYYQIQAIQLHGESSYSNIIEINNQKSEDQLLLYPNPAQDEVRVDLSSYAGKPAIVQIHDAFGQQMAKRVINELTFQPIHFDLQNLPLGTYSVSAKIGDHKRLSKLLVIVKK